MYILSATYKHAYNKLFSNLGCDLEFYRNCKLMDCMYSCHWGRTRVTEVMVVLYADSLVRSTWVRLHHKYNKSESLSDTLTYLSLAYSLWTFLDLGGILYLVNKVFRYCIFFVELNYSVWQSFWYLIRELFHAVYLKILISALSMSYTFYVPSVLFSTTGVMKKTCWCRLCSYILRVTCLWNVYNTFFCTEGLW